MGDFENHRSAGEAINQESTSHTQSICGIGVQEEGDMPQHIEGNLQNVRKHITLVQKVQRKSRIN